MTATCPCCGTTLSAETRLDIACRDLSPSEALLVRAIASGPGRSAARLAFDVYQADAEGGPLWATTAVGVFARRARVKLRAHGIDLISIAGRRGGYRLHFPAVTE